jgi:hypothetical protein
LRAIGEREIEWISRYAEPKPPGGLFATSEAQRTPESHIDLYKRFLKISDHLLPRGDLARPTLWHWDIHAPNIFVQDNRITGLIDWQDVWVGPLFLQARHPKLVDYHGELMLKLPPDYETLPDEEEKARIRGQVEKSILFWSYEQETKTNNPLLHEVFHVSQGRNRRDTFDFCANTWDADIIPFRQCLIRMAR